MSRDERIKSPSKERTFQFTPLIIESHYKFSSDSGHSITNMQYGRAVSHDIRLSISVFISTVGVIDEYRLGPSDVPHNWFSTNHQHNHGNTVLNDEEDTCVRIYRKL